MEENCPRIITYPSGTPVASGKTFFAAAELYGKSWGGTSVVLLSAVL